MPLGATVSSSITDKRPLLLKSRDAIVLLLLLFLALTMRLAFFNGPFGSDDVVYLERAVQISKGVWTNANYNGALRYGFNIPAGFFIYLFGSNIVAANLWPLLCSLGEIAAVYMLALRLWGRRPATYAALILAFTPLHVAVATRIHADPVVSCFLTLSFVLFYFAEQHRTPSLYFLTGIAMGLVFWSKELAIVTLLPFALYPFIWRKFDARWANVIGGGLVMLLAHFTLMYLIAGDPLHAIRVVTGQVNRSFMRGAGEDSAWYYFRYLFLDIKHTWLVAIIAAAAVVLIASRRLRSRQSDPTTAYVTFWLVSLVAILSFMPVSLTPLRFAMKQSNYLTLFLAPLALLAGYQVTRMSRGTAIAVLVATLAGGFLLAAMEQQAYRVFTSNSKAAVEFAEANRKGPIFASGNNSNIAFVYSIFLKDKSLATRYGTLSEAPDPQQNATLASEGSTEGYVVMDWETMGWGRHAAMLERPRPCWKEVKRLVPTGFGLGLTVLESLLPTIEFLPTMLRQRLIPVLSALSQPRPAIVYRVNIADMSCDRRLDPAQ